MIIRDEDVFEYHERPRPGKLEVTTSKPCLTQRDLSLAYTPGVARPCLAIEKDPDLAYRFTGKGNLVAVVSNGTAVLGLGDIGALAGKPVMEGKGVLFKRFADIDVFDIELNTHGPRRDRQDRQGARAHLRRHQPRGHQGARVLLHRGDASRRSATSRSSTTTSTARPSSRGAALLNALEIIGKKIDEVRVVFCGAGAAGIACAEMCVSLGVKRENMHAGRHRGRRLRGPHREDEPLQAALRGGHAAAHARGGDEGRGRVHGRVGQGPRDARDAEVDGRRPHRLRDGEPRPRDPLRPGGADAPRRDHGHGPVGLPEPGEQRPRVPVHLPRRARRARQRDQRRDEDRGGARPGRARARGRARAGAEGLRPEAPGVRARVPRSRSRSTRACCCGRRRPSRKAAMDTGVARRPIADMEAYRESLERILGRSREVMHLIVHKARKRRVAHARVPRGRARDDPAGGARHRRPADRPAHPRRAPATSSRSAAPQIGLAPGDFEIVDPLTSPKAARYAEAYYQLRAAQGRDAAHGRGPRAGSR